MNLKDEIAIDTNTAKAGVTGFTKSLAKEVGQYGRNMNSVSPVAIETKATVTFNKTAK